MDTADARGGIEVVVGLGNPGERYANTRHNAGFMVVDLLSRRFDVSLQQRKFRAEWGMGRIAGQRLILVKPLTYMNLSGEAVREILAYYSMPGTAVLILHDDLDLPCGRIKLARRGGTGGHHGVESVIRHLGRKDFPRVKLGIGRPRNREPIESFVLDKPYPDEREAFEQMLEEAADAVQTVLRRGLGAAMNEFHGRRG